MDSEEASRTARRRVGNGPRSSKLDPRDYQPTHVDVGVAELPPPTWTMFFPPPYFPAAPQLDGGIPPLQQQSPWFLPPQFQQQQQQQQSFVPNSSGERPSSCDASTGVYCSHNPQDSQSAPLNQLRGASGCPVLQTRQPDAFDLLQAQGGQSISKETSQAFQPVALTFDEKGEAIKSQEESGEEHHCHPGAMEDTNRIQAIDSGNTTHTMLSEESLGDVAALDELLGNIDPNLLLMSPALSLAREAGDDAIDWEALMSNGDSPSPASTQQMLQGIQESLMRHTDMCAEESPGSDMSAESMPPPPPRPATATGLVEELPPIDPTKITNSTSTIHASTTISSPDANQIILCMAAVIHEQLIHDSEAPVDLKQQFAAFSDAELCYVYSQRRQSSGVELSEQDLLFEITCVPSVDDIYRFLWILYGRAQYSPECNIIALVYVNRAIASSHLTLTEWNWRPILLVALILAQKVWDDKSLRASSFAQIFPQYTKEHIKRWELNFLSHLNYTGRVTQAQYARYYFELRALYSEINKEEAFPLKEMSRADALRLEVVSSSFKIQPKKGSSKGSKGRRKAKDLEEATSHRSPGRYVQS